MRKAPPQSACTKSPSSNPHPYATSASTLTIPPRHVQPTELWEHTAPDQPRDSNPAHHLRGRITAIIRYPWGWRWPTRIPQLRYRNVNLADALQQENIDTNVDLGDIVLDGRGKALLPDVDACASLRQYMIHTLSAQITMSGLSEVEDRAWNNAAAAFYTMMHRQHEQAGCHFRHRLKLTRTWGFSW